MPGAEAIPADLAQVAAAISRAQEEALAAAEHARRATIQAAGIGLTGVVRQLDGIRAQIQAIHAILGDAATAAKDADGNVCQINEQASPAEVVVQLTGAIQRIDATRDSLYAAARQIAAVKGNVEQTLRGAQPGPLLQRLDFVRQLASIAVQRGDGVKQSLDAAIANAGRLGHGLTGAATAGSGAARTDSRDDQFDGAAVRVPAAPADLPDRPDDEGPTSGRLFDDQGRQILSEAVVSGRGGSLQADLVLPRRARLSEAMASHVEPKVALMMRKGEVPQHVVLVINNAQGPCGWLARRRGDRMYGSSCDEILAGILPAGSTLTVRWRDEEGLQRCEVYRGTGEWIRRPA